MNHDIHKLRDFLESIQPGPVPKDMQSELVTLVDECWDKFDGSRGGGMNRSKVGRMEDPFWRPPHLFFTIERHGGTVMGSTRAELQGWHLNLDECTASYDSAGYRQLYPRAKPWKAGPVAEELAQAIMDGKEDTGLKWLGEGKNQVKTLTPQIIPDYYLSPDATTNGRRSRFYKAMEKILVPAGWQRAQSVWRKIT